jgi:hypothetical protein
MSKNEIVANAHGSLKNLLFLQICELFSKFIVTTDRVKVNYAKKFTRIERLDNFCENENS